MYEAGDKVIVRYRFNGHGLEDRRATILKPGYMADSWLVMYEKNLREEVVHQNFIRLAEED